MDDSTARDLRAGIALRDLTDGAMVPGVVDGEEAILLRADGELYALGGLCTHYHAKLCDGLLTGTVLRCPMHHAQFDVRTGEALCAPALDALSCWRVEQVGDQAVVRERIVAPPRRSRPVDASPQRIVIVGGGAAGLAAADMLRRHGFAGSLTMISAEADPPIDRPNLSKDFLAGNAQADWMPLRPQDWYAEQHIDLLLNRLGAFDRCQGPQGACWPTAGCIPSTRCCLPPARSRSSWRARGSTGPGADAAQL